MTEASTFFCPITQELMEDPVIDPDGNSYERSAIENWLRTNTTSPITRQPLQIADLRPNRALKTAIDEYRTTNIVVKRNIVAVEETEIPHADITVSANYLDGFLKISLKPPEIEHRSPCDICCVVDTSGSMAIEAEIQDQKERAGLSRLDLVKHSVKTIIQSLQAQDRLSVVSFSNRATVLFQLTKMDPDGKSSALAALERLEDDGQTNLWDGLRQGVEVLLNGQRATGSNAALFLLTDGCPNVEPPRGHLPTLQKLKRNTNFTCSINTFGFGYDLDSKLLEEISILGNSGTYSFIPDGSFVGTIFVNAITTLLTTVATDVRVVISGETIQPSLYTCWQSKIEDGDKTTFSVGQVVYGQTKHVFFPISEQSLGKLQLAVEYDTVSEKGKTQPIPIDTNSQNANRIEFARENFRFRFIDCVRSIFEVKRSNTANATENQNELQGATEKLKQLEADMAAFENGQDPYVQDLLKDLTGQVAEAISKAEWFKKWGVHYLPSLTRAHLLQNCNNFKDPGVQHYGSGRLFADIRDEMDTIFCSLPAPKRSQVPTAAATAAAAIATVDMSAYYNPSGGCFYGQCSIQLADGSRKLVCNVQPGDRLAPFGATVRYVVKNQCTNGKAKMVMLDQGLIISAWHPVRIDHQWIMPCNLVTGPIEIETDEIYNFVLDQGHTVLVNDVECVTLGHGFQDDIVRHRYYGTEQVVNDLRYLDLQQNSNGVIVVSSDAFLRNSTNGTVISLRPTNEQNFRSIFVN